VPTLNFVEGSVASLIGILVMSGARRLARINRDHPWLARFSLFPKFWQRDDVVRILTMFWLFCGLLWLLSGLGLILNLSPAIHFP